MSFVGDLQLFGRKVERRGDAVFVASVSTMRDSIKFGSALTGAPAMPVAPPEFPRAGSLRASVKDTYPDPTHAIISTTSKYALDVEDNAKGHTFNEGGPHGWALTAAAFPRVVETTAQRIARYG